MCGNFLTYLCCCCSTYWRRKFYRKFSDNLKKYSSEEEVQELGSVDEKLYTGLRWSAPVIENEHVYTTLKPRLAEPSVRIEGESKGTNYRGGRSVNGTFDNEDKGAKTKCAEPSTEEHIYMNSSVQKSGPKINCRNTNSQSEDELYLVNLNFSRGNRKAPVPTYHPRVLGNRERRRYTEVPSNNTYQSPRPGKWPVKMATAYDVPRSGLWPVAEQDESRM